MSSSGSSEILLGLASTLHRCYWYRSSGTTSGSVGLAHASSTPNAGDVDDDDGDAGDDAGAGVVEVAEVLAGAQEATKVLTPPSAKKQGGTPHHRHHRVGAASSLQLHTTPSMQHVL